MGKLFYQFNLEDRVPADHLLRRVAEAAEFSFVRRLTRRFYSHTGCPSIDPNALTSSRRTFARNSVGNGEARAGRADGT